MEKRVNTGRAAARRTAPKLRSFFRAGQNEGMEKIGRAAARHIAPKLPRVIMGARSGGGAWLNRTSQTATRHSPTGRVGSVRVSEFQ